jgi:outer membrane protein assembly factor BamB
VGIAVTFSMLAPCWWPLSNDGQLVVFDPSSKDYKELARYKVAERADGPWSCPILTGNRVFVKDKDSLTLWTID